jgi:hypothetical protein
MEAVPQMRKYVLAGAIAVLAALATTAPAYGNGCSNSSSSSSVQQYVEQIPCAGGSQAAGSGNNTKRTLPKQIQTKIDQQGGQDAQQLENIASSSAYGAPQTAIKVKHHKAKTYTPSRGTTNGQANTVRSSSGTHTANPLAASVGVITDGSDARLIALIALMIAVAAVVVVSAFRRRRVTR